MHEVDLLRYAVGAVAGVAAQVSSRGHGLAAEDSAAVTPRLEKGGLAALTIADCAGRPAPDTSPG